MKTSKRWAVFTLLMAWGVFSLLILAGDEVQPVSTGKYLTIKAIALASLGACYLTGRWLSRKGMMPPVKEV